MGLITLTDDDYDCTLSLHEEEPPEQQQHPLINNGMLQNLLLPLFAQPISERSFNNVENMVKFGNGGLFLGWSQL